MFTIKSTIMQKRTVGFMLFSILLSLVSCIKHEVIPPPINTVDLDCNFLGTINGTNTEYTQNVQGYNCYNDDNLYYTNPSPNLSNCLYTAEIRSFQQNQKVKIIFGPLKWDGGVSSYPTLNMFNDFHSSNSDQQIPLMNVEDMTGTNAGVQIEYTDSNGDKWETSTDDQPGVVIFTLLNQDSDNTGDYSLFECSFSIKVFREDPNQGLLSLNLNNCKFRGWFKR